MKTQLKRMLFCQAFMKTTACIVLSACTLSAMAYSEESMTQVSEITQQNRTVKGNVTDANGTPIIGANVMEKVLQTERLRTSTEISALTYRLMPHW